MEERLCRDAEARRWIDSLQRRFGRCSRGGSGPVGPGRFATPQGGDSRGALPGMRPDAFGRLALFHRSLTSRGTGDSTGNPLFRAGWRCPRERRAMPAAGRPPRLCACRLGRTPTSLLYLSLERRRAVSHEGRLGPHGAPTGGVAQAPHRGNPGVGSRIRLVVFGCLRRGFSVWDRRHPSEAKHFPG